MRLIPVRSAVTPLQEACYALRRLGLGCLPFQQWIIDQASNFLCRFAFIIPLLVFRVRFSNDLFGFVAYWKGCMGRICRFSQRYRNMKVRSQVGQSKVELEGPAWRHFSNDRATIVGFPRLNSAVDFIFRPFLFCLPFSRQHRLCFNRWDVPISKARNTNGHLRVALPLKDTRVSEQTDMSHLNNRDAMLRERTANLLRQCREQERFSIPFDD